MIFALLVLLARPATGQFLAITNVNVIEVRSGRSKSDRTVLIKGECIEAVGKTGRIKLPEGAAAIDGTGKYLIPGLWDMHVHLSDVPNFSALCIANGVTGVRDMFGFMTNIVAERRAIANGKPGPRMVAAGQLIDGPKPVYAEALTASSEFDGRQAVRIVKESGADFVKVYQLLPRAAYFGVAAEAKCQGLVLAGHVPDAVTAAEASDLGQKSIEHLTGILKACSTQETELMRSGQTVFAAQRDLATVKLLAQTYDRAKARALFARFKRNRTWQCPTMAAMYNYAYLREADLTNDWRLRYVDKETASFWETTRSDATNWPPAVWQALQLDYRQREQLVSAMRRAGVEFLAGTDTPNPYCIPGFCLHDELARLVEAGLTPAQALQAATADAASYLGMEKQVGTIQPGELADLVLLNANPLLRIHNTTNIQAVIANGRLLDRRALDRLLAEAKTGARSEYQLRGARFLAGQEIKPRS